MADRARLDTLCVNTIRMLAADGVQQARSGHPGMPMGAAAMAYALWTRLLRHNPANPSWPDRDRFVLSAGHGSMLLYALLHLAGYDLSLDDLKQFRQWGSRTPGHPEYGHTPGVETTTGPLGQGVANAVGMAVAERWLAAEFNRPGHSIVDHRTYAIAGDGDLMEGVSAEAASLAGHLRLGRLTVLYDDNRISIDGGTELAFTEDVGRRFDAYGWQVLRVSDGNDLDAVEAALRAAQAEEGRPSLVICRTHIGFGSPNRQDSSKAHGEPLGEEELRLTKQRLDWPTEPSFLIPEEARQEFGRARERGQAWEADWRARFEGYARAYPAEAKRWQAYLTGKLPSGWDGALPAFGAGDPPVATRAVSGKVLQALFPAVTNLLGGSADLAPSNNTYVAGVPEFQANSYHGRNFRFGVREHAMGAIASGMALHGGLRPYVGTFLVFADYMRPAIRLAALMRLPVVYVFTHDSIGLGEDGPTHQPVEQLTSLRTTPNLDTWRPADTVESAVAWKHAIERKDGPSALIFSRQNLPFHVRDNETEAAIARGGYILKNCAGEPELILIATGSEVSLAVQAADQLAEQGRQVRVVSMPCTSVFDAQDAAYKQLVLPVEVGARIAIEAAHADYWYKYVGLDGRIIGMTSYGESAPAGQLFEEFGFTVDNILAVAEELLED